VRAAILAVDDAPANLLALQAVIGSLGYEFVAAGSGAQALELISTREFAVILLDVMMPEMDGLTTLERLRALPHGRTTPVVFLTARDLNEAHTNRAYALGALDYIVKPVSADILRGKLRSLVALYEQAQEIRRQSEQLAIKDRHIAVLAHDLRNPLATMMMCADRLQKLDQPQLSGLGDRIARAAARMLRLTEDLLESARTAAAELRPQLETTDLAALCGELLEELALTYPNVRFQSNLALHAHGSWDRARLTQALSNLLVNAIKYGSGWVSLDLACTADGVSVSIENAGAAIAPEHLAQIFEPFVQGKDRVSGVGLGLYIVRQIARAHGGDVEASSGPEGTRFVLRLPR
jgi:signal transduction histidine kinase